MREQIEADRKQRQMEQQQRHDDVAKKAQSIWLNSQPVSNHPYLTKKKIQPHNARLYNGALVVPIYDKHKTLVNLQFIDSDGNKRFLSGGKKKGCFSVIGKPSNTILICEGFATAASLHEHTQNFVVVAMDAGNLEPVAVEIRKQHQDSQIIICGDNNASGVGQLKARSAALACGGAYKIPATVGADWNDVLNGGV